MYTDREDFDLSAIQREVQQRLDQNTLLESSIMEVGVTQLANLCDEHSQKSRYTTLDYTEYTLSDSYDEESFIEGVNRTSTPISYYESDLLITISDESD
jgi:hypothetical protein